MDAWVGLLPELRLRTPGGGPGDAAASFPAGGGTGPGGVPTPPGPRYWAAGCRARLARSHRFRLPVPDLWRGRPGPGSRRPPLVPARAPLCRHPAQGVARKCARAVSRTRAVSHTSALWGKHLHIASPHHRGCDPATIVRRVERPCAPRSVAACSSGSGPPAESADTAQFTRQPHAVPPGQLSTAGGGCDAVVGGVEQRRRGSIRRSGPNGPVTPRCCARGRSTALERSRSAVGGRGLAA